MKGSVRVLTCAVAILVLCSLFDITESAVIVKRIGNGLRQARMHKFGDKDFSYLRQLPAESSVEESEEVDDEEDDAEEQLQQSIIRQQQLEAEEAQALEDSEEGEINNDDEEEEDSLLRRRRRDTINMPSEVEKQPNETTEKMENAAGQAAEAEKLQATENAAAVLPVVAAQPTRKPSVLILIRDALKKVTTGLQKDPIATSALQYFQLFEHFLQQTIEQVIGGDDDEDEEATTVKTETEQKPDEVIKAPEAPAVAVVPAESSMATEAPVAQETAAPQQPDVVEAVSEIPAEVAELPAEVMEIEQKPAAVEPAKVEIGTNVV